MSVKYTDDNEKSRSMILFIFNIHDKKILKKESDNYLLKF